jgi:hypothetical protein
MLVACAAMRSKCLPTIKAAKPLGTSAAWLIDPRFFQLFLQNLACHEDGHRFNLYVYISGLEAGREFGAGYQSGSRSTPDWRRDNTSFGR